MPDVPNPEKLDELDRRVYDLAILPIPLAEIAVRLGVPVRQADERVQRVCDRLGVADRAALRAWTAPPPVAEETPVEQEAAEVAVGELPRSHSRRAFVAAGGLASVAAVGGAAGLWALTRSKDPSPDIGVQPPADASPTKAPVSLPITVEAGLGTAYAKANWFQNSSSVDWRHGLFRMFTGTGSIEGFQFLAQEPLAGLPAEFSGYWTGGGGRFITATNPSSGREHLLDLLNTEATWSWPAESMRAIAIGGGLPDDYVLVEEMLGRQGTGRFHVLEVTPAEPDLRIRWSFEIPEVDTYSRVATQPRGQKLMLWTGGASGPLLYLIDASTGDISLLLGKQNLQPSDLPGSFSWTPFPFEVFPEWARATWLVRDSGGLATYLSASFDWSGNIVHDVFLGGYDISFSPDRKSFVQEVSERMTWIEGSDGGREFWTNVESGTWGFPAAFRIRSASIKYGDAMPPARWLADGSRFVAQVRGTSEPDGSTTYQAALVAPDGQSLLRLPQPPRAPEPRRWFEYEWHYGPVPSPFDSDLIAFGRLALYNRRRDEWFVARVAGDAGPDHLDPWCAGEGFFVFALPHGGHGGASGPVFLPPSIERPPFTEEFLFQVVGTGDGLNLRDAPSLDARVHVTIADGTELRLAEDNSRPVGLKSVEWTPTGTWIYVEAPGQVYGWAFSEYLAWA